jgi:hypothetical protein
LWWRVNVHWGSNNSLFSHRFGCPECVTEGECVFTRTDWTFSGLISFLYLLSWSGNRH